MIKKQINNIGVLVTRPEYQAGPLVTNLSQRGFQPYLFPTIEILPSENLAHQQTCVELLDKENIALFVSANAVKYSGELLRTYWPTQPTGLQIAAIGPATKEALSQLGYKVHIMPEKEFSSEGLLAHPAFQDVFDTAITLFKGLGGREILTNTLQDRGALVRECICYERKMPQSDVDPLLAALEQGALQVAICTSGESLTNLYKMVANHGAEALNRLQLLLMSERLVPVARELGYTNKPLVAREASEKGILETLVEWEREKWETNNE